MPKSYCFAREMPMMGLDDGMEECSALPFICWWGSPALASVLREIPRIVRADLTWTPHLQFTGV
jgi:hypothetical protein